MFKLFLFWILGMCSGSMILHVSFLELSGMQHVIVKWRGIRPENEIAHFTIAILFEVGHHKLVQGNTQSFCDFPPKVSRKKYARSLERQKEIRPTANQWSFGGCFAPCRRPLGVLDAWGVCSRFSFGWLGKIPPKFALPKPLHLVWPFSLAKVRNVWAVGCSLPPQALKKIVTDLW